ncbi:MAG: adenosylcobinamide-GDP ribazoletransferase [Candidatus Omnitrophica bacterium]|nr:adenosylcobinamide-GDP ribazoletransferase [Candidatus Omnitrophota bacterium]
MKSFVAALQFLTVFPVAAKFSTDSFSRSVRYFPLVGVMLAAILAAAYWLMRFKLDDGLVCLILVTLLFFLTKGLHADGVSDTFDALFSGKSKDQMLDILKDPHSGALGTSALILVFLLKIFLLNKIYESEKIAALFLMLAGSRGGMSLMLGAFPYARGPEGLGFAFKENLKRLDWMMALGISLAVAIVAAGFSGALALTFAVASMYGFAAYAAKKLGGITGDVLGAANEIGEIAILFGLILHYR